METNHVSFITPHIFLLQKIEEWARPSCFYLLSQWPPFSLLALMLELRPIITIMRSVVILDLRWLKCLLNNSPRPRFRNSLFNLVPKAFPLKNRVGREKALASAGHVYSLIYGYNSTRALIGCWEGKIFLQWLGIIWVKATSAKAKTTKNTDKISCM